MPLGPINTFWLICLCGQILLGEGGVVGVALSGFSTMAVCAKVFPIAIRCWLNCNWHLTERYHVMRQGLRGASLSPGMEEKLFFQAQGAIDSKIFPFPVPRFKRVHLLWIDPAQSSLPYRKALQRVLGSRAFYRGHPVLVSQCLNPSTDGALD